MSWPPSRWTWAVAGLTALGAARRFATIADQSFWRDEALTVWESSKSLGGMLSTIPNTEGHPPVYPLAAWAWVQLFGTSETAVRSLSALAGTATIPVVYAAASTLASRRAGIVAAALVAASPFGLWYSQEARPYSLMLLFGACSFLAFAKLLKAPERRWIVIWGIASALALATHYFSAFLLVPEALWLLRTVPMRRAMLLSTGAVAATALALLPLLLHQREEADAQWVGNASGQLRLRGIAEDLVLGPQLHRTVAVAVASVVIAGGLLALARAPRERRWPGLLVLGILAAGFAIPAAMKLVGSDYLLSRYVAVLFIPLVVLVAIALTVREAGLPGLAGAIVLCSTMLVMGFVADSTRSAKREDWRNAAKALGAPRADRAIVAAPALTYAPSTTIPPPISVYLDRTRAMPRAGARVREIYVVRVVSPSLPHARLPPIPAAFREVERKSTEAFSVTRYRARRPTWFRPEVPGDPRGRQSSVVVQSPVV